LPKVRFERVREIVEASLQLSGSASAAVIADQMGRTAKGQAWSEQWGTVQFLGFIEKTADGKYNVTELGRRFVGQDVDDAAKAAQEGLMRSGFGPLINRFGTGTPNLRAIANVLLSDYNVPEAAARRAAELLAEMAGECRLVVDGRFKPAEIERAQEAAGAAASALPQSPAPKPTPPKHGAAPRSAAAPHASQSQDSMAARPGPAPEYAPHGRSGLAPDGGAAPIPFGLGPIVVLNIDATKLTGLELTEIIREVRKTGESS
jgi:hypothetical protein